MPTYLYRCNTCGSPEQHSALLADENLCPLSECGGQLRRDWKAEGANVAIENLKREREGS